MGIALILVNLFCPCIIISIIFYSTYGTNKFSRISSTRFSSVIEEFIYHGKIIFFSFPTKERVEIKIDRSITENELFQFYFFHFTDYDKRQTSIFNDEYNNTFTCNKNVKFFSLQITILLKRIIEFPENN